MAIAVMAAVIGLWESSSLEAAASLGHVVKDLITSLQHALVGPPKLIAISPGRWFC